MFHDARRIPAGTIISATICIVGTGPAGLVLSRALSAAGHKIVMLEAGGQSTSAAAQQSAHAENLGISFLPGHISRRRAFGGTSRWWAGFCRPLDREVFEQRPWIADSGWPVAFETLAPHYSDALSLLDIGAPAWDPVEWHQGIKELFSPAEAAGAFHPVNLYRAPRRFLGATHRDALRHAQNIDVYLHAHAAHIQLNGEGSAVKSITVRCIGGNELRVEARYIVMATGGIENARLLLASHDIQAAGIGNADDHVGRYLMNHPHLAAAWIPLGEDTRSGQRARSQRKVPEVQRVGLDPARAAQEEIAQFSAYLYPVSGPHNHPWARSAGYSSLIALLGINRVAAVQQDPRPLIGAVVRDVPGVVRDLACKVANRFTDQPYLCAIAETEQVPNRHSRVTLSDTRDVFGAPLAAVDWRLTDQDKRTLTRGIEILDDTFQACGFRPAVRESWLLNEDLENYPGEDWAHHAGTTRMSADPRSGVVDTDCRVHGVANLFMAGCSVFPTEGMAPPTLTIMALALRLAEHLRMLLENLA